MWQRLVDECGVEVAESTVRAYVAEVRAEIAGNVSDVPIVQDHQDGAESEVDFGEFMVYIAGVFTKRAGLLESSQSFPKPHREASLLRSSRGATQDERETGGGILLRGN